MWSWCQKNHLNRIYQDISQTLVCELRVMPIILTFYLSWAFLFESCIWKSLKYFSMIVSPMKNFLYIQQEWSCLKQSRLANIECDFETELQSLTRQRNPYQIPMKRLTSSQLSLWTFFIGQQGFPASLSFLFFLLSHLFPVLSPGSWNHVTWKHREFEPQEFWEHLPSSDL